MKQVIPVCTLAVLTACTGVARATTYSDTVGDYWGPAENDIVSVDVVNDAQNLSFTIRVNPDADFSVNYYPVFEVGIQTNGGAGGQTAINGNWGLGDPTIGNGYGTPVGISTGMNFFIGSYLNGPDYSGGAELFAYSSTSGWAKLGGTAPIAQVSTTDPSLSFSFPLADLGLSEGDSFLFDVWSTYSGANSAYDALQNPVASFFGTSDLPYSQDGNPPANYDSATHNGTIFSTRPYTVLSPVVNGTWTGATSAAWSETGNWTGGIPDGAGHTATFDATASGNFNVSVDGARTVGSLSFVGASGYTLAGTGSLLLDSSSGPATISASGGSHAIAVPITLNDDLVVTTDASSHLSVTREVTATGRSVTKAGAGSAQFENVRAAALNVGAGSLRISQKAAANSAPGTSIVSTLSIAEGAQLDLKNNALVIDYADGNLGTLLEEVRDHLLDGRLTTTTATNRRLGYVDSGSRTSFGGVTVDGSSVLIGYAAPGDGDLDGAVNFNDLLALAQNYGQSNRVWESGDYDYSGDVTFNDLLLLAQNYGASGFVTGVDFASDWALARSLAPEPASLFAALFATSLARRRRFA